MLPGCDLCCFPNCRSPQRLALQGALAETTPPAAMDADVSPPGANGIAAAGAHAAAAAATPGAAQGSSGTRPDGRQEAGSTGAARPAAGGQQRRGTGLPPKAAAKLQPPAHAGRPGSRQIPSAEGVAAGSKKNGGNAVTGVHKSIAAEAGPTAGKLAAPPSAATAGVSLISRIEPLQPWCHPEGAELGLSLRMPGAVGGAPGDSVLTLLQQRRKLPTIVIVVFLNIRVACLHAAGGAVGSRLRHEAALLAQDFSTAAAGPLENGRCGSSSVDDASVVWCCPSQPQCLTPLSLLLSSEAPK